MEVSHAPARSSNSIPAITKGCADGDEEEDDDEMPGLVSSSNWDTEHHFKTTATSSDERTSDDEDSRAQDWGSWDSVELGPDPLGAILSSLGRFDTPPKAWQKGAREEQYKEADEAKD